MSQQNVKSSKFQYFVAPRKFDLSIYDYPTVTAVLVSFKLGLKVIGQPNKQHVAVLQAAVKTRELEPSTLIAYYTRLSKQIAPITPFGISPILKLGKEFELKSGSVEVKRDGESIMSIPCNGGFAQVKPYKDLIIEEFNLLAAELAVDMVSFASVVNGVPVAAVPDHVPEALSGYHALAKSRKAMELLEILQFPAVGALSGNELAAYIYKDVLNAPMAWKMASSESFHVLSPSTVKNKVVEGSVTMTVPGIDEEGNEGPVKRTFLYRKCRMPAPAVPKKHMMPDIFAFIKLSSQYVGAKNKGMQKMATHMMDGVPLPDTTRLSVSYWQDLKRFLDLSKQTFHIGLYISDFTIAAFIYSQLPSTWVVFYLSSQLEARDVQTKKISEGGIVGVQNFKLLKGGLLYDPYGQNLSDSEDYSKVQELARVAVSNILEDCTSSNTLITTQHYLVCLSAMELIKAPELLLVNEYVPAVINVEDYMKKRSGTTRSEAVKELQRDENVRYKTYMDEFSKKNNEIMEGNKKQLHNGNVSIATSVRAREKFGLIIINADKKSRHFVSPFQFSKYMMNSLQHSLFYCFHRIPYIRSFSVNRDKFYEEDYGNIVLETAPCNLLLITKNFDEFALSTEFGDLVSNDVILDIQQQDEKIINRINTPKIMSNEIIVVPDPVKLVDQPTLKKPLLPVPPLPFNDRRKEILAKFADVPTAKDAKLDVSDNEESEDEIDYAKGLEMETENPTAPPEPFKVVPPGTRTLVDEIGGDHPVLDLDALYG